MFFTPSKNKSNTLVATAFFIVAAVALSFSSLFGSYRIVGQTLALLAFSLGLWTVIRFVMPKYEYELDGTDLIIRRLTGTRRETLGCMTLTSGIAIVKTPKTADEKTAFSERFGKTTSRFNFCTNIKADAYTYVTEFAKKRIEVLLECDENFAAEIEKRLTVSDDCGC